MVIGRPVGSGWRKPALILVASVVAVLILAMVLRHWIELALQIPTPVATTVNGAGAMAPAPKPTVGGDNGAGAMPAPKPPAGRDNGAGAIAPAPLSQRPPESAAELQHLLSAEDRQQIVELQSRLKRNPRDEQAAGELREKLRGYLKQIQGAVREGDLVQAESWVEEIRPLDPDNRNLARAVELIRKERRQAAAPKD